MHRLSIMLTGLAVLCLQGCSAPHDPAPVDRLYRGKTFLDYERASLNQATYRVQAGETLYSIAFRANMDLREIAQLNGLSDPYVIFVGQELQLRPSVTESTSGASPTSRAVAGRDTREYGESHRQNDAQTTGMNHSATTQGQVPSNLHEVRWQWPSQGRVVRRFSAQQAGGRGIEFSGNRGDPVFAAASGRIVYVGSALRGYGQLIIVKHNDDYITAYGHNDQLLVREQQWVEAGEQIATMGSSGRDDVRLRFELRFRGNSVNPENYLPRQR